MTETEPGIYGGADTHGDVHAVAIVDHTGRIRDVESFPASATASSSCSRGCDGTARSCGSGSKGPAATAPASPVPP